MDARYFFGEGADSVHVNPIMYPNEATILKCGIMHDGGTEELLKMWSRVKGSNASIWTYTLIILVFAGLITIVILKYTRKAYRKKMHSKKRRK